ncbi:hypothetical protein F3Y22_tig00109926pilonHSYRG00198 [Hibiscus syriacus]|uniref:Uncharacterized protein n=1 Tax=Hibiscus syriacus TaxID=106335 RepID=A0A6A3BS88_HIBSY|nr:hypothetical protein F3Y22_tig00109926pilonHSYRG00198 [Hibiscus syriacus]
MGSRLVWAMSNYTVFVCVSVTAIISLVSVREYSQGIEHVLGGSGAIKIAALIIFALLGFPLAITYSVPFSVTAELTADSGGGQGSIGNWSSEPCNCSSTGMEFDKSSFWLKSKTATTTLYKMLRNVEMLPFSFRRWLSSLGRMMPSLSITQGNILYLFKKCRDVSLTSRNQPKDGVSNLTKCRNVDMPLILRMNQCFQKYLFRSHKSCSYSSTGAKMPPILNKFRVKPVYDIPLNNRGLVIPLKPSKPPLDITYRFANSPSLKVFTLTHILWV